MTKDEFVLKYCPGTIDKVKYPSLFSPAPGPSIVSFNCLRPKSKFPTTNNQ